jgi:hypothetical protein
MKKPTISDYQIADKATELTSEIEKDDVSQDGPQQQISSRVWGAMLDLIYSGNAPAARKLLNKMYKADTELVFESGFDEGHHAVPLYRDGFWKLLTGYVSRSMYYPALKKMNNNYI